MKFLKVPMVLLLIALAIGVAACGSSAKHASSANAVANEIKSNKAVQSDVKDERSVIAKCLETTNPIKGVRAVETCLISQGIAKPEDRKCIEVWFKHALTRAILHGLPSRKDVINAITGCVKTK